MKRILLLIAGIGTIAIAAWLGMSFPAANATPVDLDLLWFRIPNLEVWSLMLVSVGTGVFVTSVFGGFLLLRGWIVGRRYRKIIKRLESELHQLRSLPLVKEDRVAHTRTAKPVAKGRS